MSDTATIEERSLLTTLAKMVAKELGMEYKNQTEETKHITFADARAALGCSDDTLTKRIQAAGIKTYRWGKGKAFDRKHLFKLMG